MGSPTTKYEYVQQFCDCIAGLFIVKYPNTLQKLLDRYSGGQSKGIGSNIGRGEWIGN